MNALKHFPYTPREHQLHILDFLDKMEAGRHLVFEAANGAGKTIVALTSAIAYRDSLPEPESYRILVLSRTNSQADRVIEELRKMKTKIYAMSKRGKESMCNNPEIKNYPNIPFNARCEMLKKRKKCGFYTKYVSMHENDKLESTRDALLFLPMVAEDITNEAEMAGVCAAELANSLVKYCDIISGSYLYLFDEEIRHSFVKQLGVEQGHIILVIDECHNLPNIVLQTNERELNAYQIEKAKSEVGRESVYLTALHQAIVDIKRDGLYSPKDFMERFETLLAEVHIDYHDTKDHAGQVIRHLADTASAYKRKKRLNFCYSELVVKFLAYVYNDFDKEYFTLVREKRLLNGKPNGFRLRFCLLNPANHIKTILQGVNCSISMSGSMSIPAYLTMTGIRWLKHDTYSLPSPYDLSNICILVTKGLTSQYNQRNPKTYAKMAELIQLMMKQGKNTGLFLPSYAVKDGVKPHIKVKKIFEATRDMNSDDTDKLVEKFKKERGALFLSVMGGRSSEGTDFKGDSMEMVIIAGIPYGMPDVLSKARIEYFNQKDMGGFDLISKAPAFQQLSQAAGRPLRSLDDRVFVLIMDYRVMKDVKRLPSWMHNAEFIEADVNVLERKLEKFYD